MTVPLRFLIEALIFCIGFGSLVSVLAVIRSVP